MDITHDVLLPEALTRLVRDCCGISQEQAEKYLCEGGFQTTMKVLDFVAMNSKAKTGKKLQGKKAIKKVGGTDSDLQDDGNDYVHFIKRAKVDKGAKMQLHRPKFNLEKEDAEVRQGRMLSDRHIAMAQNILHKQI